MNTGYCEKDAYHLSTASTSPPLPPIPSSHGELTRIN